MRSTFLFSCIMALISDFTIFFIFQIFIFIFFFINITDCCIFVWSCCSFLNNFIFLFLKPIIFIAYCLKDSQNFFIQTLSWHTSCLFPMLLNEKVVDIEKPDGICFLALAVDEFLGLFLYSSILSIIQLRST